MITFSNSHRSNQTEIMDDLDFHGPELKNLLDDLGRVNRWLGGTNITLDGLRKLLKKHPKNQRIVILDIGCGDGAMLRECADLGKKNGFLFDCVGLDFNANILEIAENESRNYPNITFKKLDVFSNQELIPNCDIALCTLFLHHFSSKKIARLLYFLAEKSTIGVIINDLQRSKQAFCLFKIVANLFLKTKTAKHDGLISIARGFKKSELEDFTKAIPNQKSTIRWRWAYRYQWVLKKKI